MKHFFKVLYKEHLVVPSHCKLPYSAVRVRLNMKLQALQSTQTLYTKTKLGKAAASSKPSEA